MLPKSEIIIKPNGDSEIRGLEQSNQCFKLSELARSAGKVNKETPIDHPPVHQTVARR